MTGVTVIIPAYNEGETFASNLVTLADHFSIHQRNYGFKYIIVDDGSRDETFVAAEAFARWRENVYVFQHPHNQGLGAALRTAFREVETEYAIVLDADLSYEPSTGMQLLEALERQKADIALASAYVRGGSVVNVPLLRRVLSREANRLLSFASAGKYATFTCMVRAFRVSAMKQLEFESNGMDAIAEMLLDGLRKQLRVVEVPATLKWSAERRAAPGRLRPARLLKQMWATIRMAFEYRPSLWLAVPGLIPGLLPVVVAVLLLLRVSPWVLAAGTATTVVIQYTSLAIFAGQAGTFFTRRLQNRRHSQIG